MTYHIDPITEDSLEVNLYHLNTDTLVTVTPRLHGYYLVEVSDRTGIVYKCLHDTHAGAVEDAQAHYDALGDDL